MAIVFLHSAPESPLLVTFLQKEVCSSLAIHGIVRVTVTSSSWTSRRLQVPSQPQNSEGHSHFFECLGCSLVNLTKKYEKLYIHMAFLVDFQNMPYLIKQSQNKPIFLPYIFLPHWLPSRIKIIVCLLCLMLHNLTDSNLVLDPPPRHASQHCRSSSGASQVALFIYWQQVRCLPPHHEVILTSPQHTDVWGTTPK